ncbi:MAG: HNH endonuclease [Nannocystaceae bacterium]
MDPRQSELLSFAARVVELPRHGARVSTYKPAVLIALLDLCLERTRSDGTPPSTVTTGQIADKVIALYWPQVRRFEGDILNQHCSGKAKIPRIVADARWRSPERNLGAFRRGDIDRYAQLVGDVEWELIKSTLPRLQALGAEGDEFLFAAPWRCSGEGCDPCADLLDHQGRALSRSEVAEDPELRTLRFHGEASGYLAHLHGFLRPLLEREWVESVAAFNRLSACSLHDFLFGADPQALGGLVEPLLALEDQCVCFYCRQALAGKVVVDHFIPWSRSADNDLANLVVAHSHCAERKRGHLAALHHVERWRYRNESGDLDEIAAEHEWEHEPDRSLGIARANYLNLPDAIPLWAIDDEFEAMEAPRARAVLGGM